MACADQFSPSEHVVSTASADSIAFTVALPSEHTPQLHNSESTSDIFKVMFLSRKIEPRLLHTLRHDKQEFTTDKNN